MKTAISVEDSLMAQVDEAARKEGISRSKFFSIAAAEELKKRRSEEITRALNEVYADEDQAEELRLVALMKAKPKPWLDKW
jgi:metal-responsive CopG/Arc/MetJ family transcriptional regulator